MTASGDFMASDSQELEQAAYPTVFGVQLTPVVSGAAIFLVGAAVAFYLYSTFVQPQLAEQQRLQAEIDAQEALLVDPAQLQSQLDAATARRDESEQLRDQVLALYAEDDNLDVLLLDLNARVESVSGITELSDAELTQFEFLPGESGVITDSSFGQAVNHRLQRQVYNVQMDATFAQTQNFFQNFERLQPLTVIRNYSSSVNPSNYTLSLNEQGQPVIINDPDVPDTISTSFQLNVLLPSPPGTYEAATQPVEGEEGAEATE